MDEFDSDEMSELEDDVRRRDPRTSPNGGDRVPALSLPEFRNRTYELLKRSGVVDSLKSQLRASVLGQLQLGRPLSARSSNIRDRAIAGTECSSDVQEVNTTLSWTTVTMQA